MTLPVLASTLSTANGTSANDGGRRREDDTNIVVYAMRSDAMREGTAKTPSADADGYVRLRDPGMGIDENIAPTLKAGTAHAVAVSSQPAAASRARATRAVRQGMAVRRLTPLECERLQGFADDWTVGFSDAIRYRMLGNAVPVPVSAWIGRRLVAVDARRAA